VVSGELVSLEQQEQDVRRDVERAAGKKEWVEEFRGWVETLGGFLEEKVSRTVRSSKMTCQS
jgi:GC-rich sequence DNA-binding factor